MVIWGGVFRVDFCWHSVSRAVFLTDLSIKLITRFDSRWVKDCSFTVCPRGQLLIKERFPCPIYDPGLGTKFEIEDPRYARFWRNGSDGRRGCLTKGTFSQFGNNGQLVMPVMTHG